MSTAGSSTAVLLRITSLVLAPAILVLAIGGCSAPPMPIPAVYALRDPSPIAIVPESRRTPTIEVIYFTDRTPDSRDDGTVAYTIGRSKSVAVGVATVDLGADSWETLSRREHLRRPSVVEVREIARSASSPIPLVESDDGWVQDPERVAVTTAMRNRAFDLIESMMLPEDEGRVTVFVHGFNVNFDDAVISAALLSELLARRGLVIAYTWPAGSGTLLRGYTHDRESGEFSIYHLRHTLRGLAQSPAVRQLNLMAHSRGTDVLTSALREINLEERAAGRSTRDTLKLGHVVLAAPDLDLEVVSQRIAAEYLHMAPISTTVYFSPRDRALGIANWLFAGVMRLGGIDFDKLDAEMRRAISDSPPEIELVDVRAKTRGLGHSYFHQCPYVSSDLYLLLAEDRRIGAENGRPLQRIEGGVWRLGVGYPDPELMSPSAIAPAADRDPRKDNSSESIWR